MGYLDYAGLQYLWGKLKEKFAPKSHSHDDRYYTEAEMDGKLSSKVDNNEAGANGLFSKLTTSWTATPTDNTYFIRQDTGGGNEFGRVKFSTLWNYIKGKTDGVYQPKGSYAASGHTHDDRYYTESEVNTKLANYQPKGNYAAASHTHNYAGSGSAGGSANSAIKLDSSAGSATQPVYFKDGKPVATTYALNKTVPADAKFTDTNTWRGIQNNLTSDSTDQSLSAAQGKALKTLVDGKAPTSHKHTKSQITDFPTSMPASDVSAWAKAATKPSYTKAEVGLSNVDNTADKDKNVKFATSAGSATNAQCLSNDSQYMRFHWNGQSGQPTWLWGGEDGTNMYVYNPGNFKVNWAQSAANGVYANGFDGSGGGYIRFCNGAQICWGRTNCSGKNTTINFSAAFSDSSYSVSTTPFYSNIAETYWNVSSMGTTSFVLHGSKGSIDLRTMLWIAIGKWN